MKTPIHLTAGAALAAIMLVPAAHAETPAAASKTGEWIVKPTLDARLRTELVRQASLDADSVTLRLRPGIVVSAPGGFSVLAEAEGTVALDHDYSGFPFASASSEKHSQFAVVADPQTAEVNRLQVQYKVPDLTVTLGRQRMSLDDARLVGNAGWRQNEQTFDAVRVQKTIGTVAIDAAYAISQRTVFGSAAGERTAYDGNLAFLGAGLPVGPVKMKGFAYLLDYAAHEQTGAQLTQLADARTLGARATTTLNPAPAVQVDLTAIWARQSAFADNPARYTVDYLFTEGALGLADFSVTLGNERLGSDGAHAFQRPAANQARFDQYIVTPAQGLNDVWAGISWRLGNVAMARGVTASVLAHRFAATASNVRYGTGTEAVITFRAGEANVLVKVADFKDATGTASWTRFWLQADLSI